MNLFGWAILAVVATIIVVSRYLSNRKYAQGPVISISNLRFEPEIGATLKSHEPVYLTFDYYYDNFDEPLYVWATVDSEELASTYQGSNDEMTPGPGEINQYFFLKKAGHVGSIQIEAKTKELKSVFQQQVDVDFLFETNEEMEAKAEDGIGSRVVSVSFSHREGTPIDAGTQVFIDIEYDITSNEGLDIWAIPQTDLTMTYEGTQHKSNGVGRITKYFTVAEPGRLESIQIVMANMAGETVYSSLVDVNFDYVAKDV